MKIKRRTYFCKPCGFEHPPTNEYWASRGNGYYSCRKRINEKARKKNRRLRAENPSTPEDLKRLRKYQANWRKANPEKVGLYESRKEPLKVAIRGLVRGLLARGHIKRKPCEVCGLKKAHAHHDDYNRPLMLRWLCDVHHKAWHRLFEPVDLASSISE